MEKATQNYRVIQPVHTSSEPAQTFVHSFATQNSDPNNTDNLYFVFTIWAPSSDIPQISKQTTEVFTENYFKSVDHRAREERFKLALKSVNIGIQELNQYYKQKDERFHIEAAILAIYKNDFLLTTSGDTHIYRKNEEKFSSLTNTKHHGSYQNMFETVLSGKANLGDKLVLASARFSDRLPRSVLYEYLQTNDTHTFDNFEQKIQSLKNHQLGIVEISFEPILEDEIVPVLAEQKASKSKTNSLQKAFKGVLGSITALFSKMS